MKDLIKTENFIDWIYETKVGHFLFLMISITIIGGIISIFVSNVFWNMLIGAFIVSIYLSISDDNEQWY